MLSLWVEGSVELPCLDTGCAVDGCMFKAATFALFEGCGTLGPGPQGCVVLYPSDGSGPVAPDNFGGFMPGTEVFVIGKLLDDVFPCFPSAIPAVLDATATACLPDFVAGCGKLSFGPQGCLLFIHYATGLAFALHDLGGFGAGATVYVEGPVNADLGGCFPILLPVIENTLIEACATPEDLDGNGTVDGADLGVLLSEWGECPFITPCSGDFDNDGDVDGADLGVLMAAFD